MSYFSFVPSFSGLLDFSKCCDFSDVAKSSVMISIGESLGIVASVAGVVALIAAAIFSETQYLAFAAIALPLGIISWLYSSEYQSIYSELQDRISVEQAAIDVKKEGEEIDEAVSKFEREIASLKAVKQQLELQNGALNASNSTLEEQIALLKEENTSLAAFHEQLTLDVKALAAIDVKIVDSTAALAVKIDEAKGETARSMEASLARTKALKERLEMIARIYERTLILQQIKGEIAALGDETAEERQAVLRALPSLRKLNAIEFK